MIAAGEVVERPASVVKELIENAIDADAKNITIEIRRGGMSFIRVTDDGCGISPEDVPTAFLRHATSKIKDESGLEAIGTLGFRGEALAAISSVSRVELTSRERGAKNGVTISLEGGVEVESGDSVVGCPEGTTIIIRDLFFNTPARLKFMKSDSAEASAAINAALRCALSHPELSFKMVKDGEEVFRTPGNGEILDAAYALLGREFALKLAVIPESGDATMSVKGLVTLPDNVRGNRGMQHFFVNGRYVKSQLLTAAVEQAFRTLLPHGRFPGCVVYITLRPNMVDVNVHPAKTEVKFMYERSVFELVHYAVKAAIGLPINTKKNEEIEQVEPVKEANVPFAPAQAVYKSSILPEPQSYHQEVIRELYARPAEPIDIIKQEIGKVPQDTFIEPKELYPVKAVEIPEYRLIGEVYTGYIVVELPAELLFIDKHAAHERIIFNRIKAEKRPPMSQVLLAPVTVETSTETAALILENVNIIDKLGFTVSDFGAGTLVIREIPSNIELSDISSLIEEIAESIKLGNRPGTLSREDEVLSTVACKAAIKLGKNSDPKEFTPLIEAVLTGQITHCPHGRPIVFRLPRETIEKAIKRK